MGTKQKWYRIVELEVEEFDVEADEWPKEIVEIYAKIEGSARTFVIATAGGGQCVQPGDLIVRDLAEDRYAKMTPAEFEEFKKELRICIWTPVGEISTILAAALRMEPKPNDQIWDICYRERRRSRADGFS